MALKPVFFIIGLLLIALGLAMLIPAAVVIHVDSYDWGGFVYGAVTTIFFGVLMALANQHPLSKFQLGVREAFLMTTLSWIFTITFASLPFILSSHNHSITDSLFEATSALTTTGATIINHLDKTNPGILLWRGILQWLGGVGIIVMALTILPLLRIGGMQLFRTESSDRTDRIMPRVSHIAKSIIAIQASLTIFFTIALILVGIKPLDAICHAMGALTTGGLSTSDNSIGGFANPAAEIIIIACMFIGSCTLTLLLRVWNGDWRSFFKDPQIRGFTYILGLATCAITAWRFYHAPHTNLIDLSRETLFTV
ncbi:MAG: TrkH family potassium uptake protein, partial [Alphaproteobacteria bacterium]|nr:TrkH family potassium uptake protein [Alphaproteobacteria bacterium]